MQEIVAMGSTVDEAVDNACAQFGLTRDDVTYEIIELPQKKLFGTSPAKVKVTPLDAAFTMKDLLRDQQAKQEDLSEERSPKDRNNRPVAKPPQQRVAQPQPKQPAMDSEQFEEEPEEPLEEVLLADLTAPAKAALEYFQAVSAKMGATQLTYTAFKTARGVKFVIDGEDSALVIGRRGETMDALQYLCMLVSSRTEGDYCKIMLDVANYRSKRAKTLQALAAREAEKVKKTLYNQTLEPMNPYERRIVHSAIQRIEGVKSESVGTEPNRRVVISMISGGKGNRNRGGRGNDHRGGDRKKGGNSKYGGNGGHNRDRRDYNKNNRRDAAYRNGQPANNGGAESASSAPKSDIDPSKLYGKIDL